MSCRIPRGLLTTVVSFVDVSLDTVHRWASSYPGYIPKQLSEMIRAYQAVHYLKRAEHLPDRDVVRFWLERPRVEGRP